MRNAILTLMLVIATFGALTIWLQSSEPKLDAEPNAIGKVSVLALRDLDGKGVLFGDERLGKGKVAFAFMANFSKLSRSQTADVLANSEEFRKNGGTLVIVCDGVPVDGSSIGARRTRKEMDDAGKALWLTPNHAPEVELGRPTENDIDVKFGSAFRDLPKLDRVPALVITDNVGKVFGAHHGRMTVDEIKKALDFK